MKSTLMKLVALCCIVSFMLSACATPTTSPQTGAATAVPQANNAGQAAQPSPTTPGTNGAGLAAPASAMDYLKADRADQVIVDNPYKLQAPDNWNPYVPNNSWNWGMSEIGTEDPMYLNYGDGKYVMWLATSFDGNADSTQWTLKLRPGITWSDGQPYTVDDIIYSVDLQMKNEKLGAHFYLVEWIDKMEKVDDLTMKFDLKKPNVRFAMENFASLIGGDSFAIVPKHIWENVSDPTTYKYYDPAKGLPIGTGPYILGKVTTNETIWVRNDNWWGAKTGFKALPQPKEIIFSYVGTEEVRAQTAIQNGFDSMQDITLGAYQAIIAQNNKWQAFYPDKPYAWPDPCARILSLNSAKKPWDDKDMRWMLNDVLNRQQIIDIAYEGTTTMAPYFWPAYPSMKVFSDLIPQDTINKMKAPNLDAAAQILTSKGYKKGAKYWAKDGKDLTIEIQVPEDFIELQRIGDVYVEELQNFGINATESKLGAAFYDNFNNGDYEAQSNWFSCGSVAEPWKTLVNFAGKAAPLGTKYQGNGIDNGFRWYNQQYTDLVAQIGVTKLDDPKLLDLTKQALAILYDELPALPAAQARKLVPFNNTYWTGWPSAANYYMTPTDWWDNFIVTITTIKKVQ